MKQLLADLRASPGLGQNFFEAFFSKSLDACLITTTDGAVIAANAVACVMFGFTEEELCAAGRSAMVVLDDPRLKALFEQRAQTGVARGQLSMKRKDGTQFEAELSSTVFAVDGGRSFTSMIIRDLTPHLEARRLAMESEQRLRFALDAGEIGDWDMDLRTGVARRSLIHDRCFGYSEPVASWGYDTFLSHVHPAHRERVNGIYQKAMAGEGEYDVEFEVVWPDQSVHWLWSRGRFYFDESGKPYRVAGIAIDISERKRMEEAVLQNEEKLRFILDSTGIGYWDVDPSTGQGFRSASLLRLYQLDHLPAKWDGRSYLDYVHPDDRAEASRRYEEARNGGIYKTEFRLIQADGSVRWVFGAGRGYLDDTGTQRRIHGITIDITEQKKIQAELEKLNAELELRIASRTASLERTNEQLEAFSYSVAHDLRSPLRSIHAFSSIVLDENKDRLDAESVDYLGRVKNAALHMSKLVDDLLKLARVSKIEPAYRNVNLAPIARTIATSLAESAPQRTEQVQVSPDMSANCDPHLLEIVLTNLIGNAWKFTSKTAAASISVGMETKDGKSVYFVRDNGAGFDMTFSEKLFTPFQRLHGQNEFDGTGIGLSIVKRIIEKHGGKVWIESAPNQGTTVSFTL